jgi:hypothetical protein
VAWAATWTSSPAVFLQICEGRGAIPGLFLLWWRHARRHRPPHFLFFRDLETSLHRRSVRNSPDAVELLSGDDNELMPEMRDFQVRPLSPDIVLVTYRSGRGDHFALRSSI